jgi:NitT/TauT family transport system substrate-binding protein
MTTTRRTFIAATAALVGAPAFAQRKPMTVITPFGYTADFGEMMNGVTGGHFARYGLDVKVLGANGTAAAIAQVLSGQAMVTRSACIDVFQAAKANNGKPALVTISTLYQNSTFNVISDKAKPIETMEAMKGKTVGIVSVRGTTELLIDAMLVASGFKPDDVKKEVVGNNAGAFALIGQGRIDCFIASVAVVAQLQQLNTPMVYFSTDKYAAMPSQCYSATPDSIQKNPEMLVAWLKGLRDSVNEILTGDYVQLLDRMGKTYEIPGIRNTAALKATNDLAMKLWVGQGKENLLRNVPSLWAKASEVLVKVGIAPPLPATDFYTNDLVDRALKA